VDSWSNDGKRRIVAQDSSTPLLLLRPLRFRDLLQILERVKTGRVAVAPDRLYGVTADICDASEFESRWRQRPIRVLVKVAHHVDLAFAARAGTTSSQCFQTHKILAAILPLDGQLSADLLDIDRLHGRSIAGAHNNRPETGSRRQRVELVMLQQIVAIFRL